jgi:hypothetical protein
MFRPLLNGVTLCLLATPALADPAAILRIEAALAAPGLAPGINARPTDIITIERIPGSGPTLLVELHPSFDSAIADLTKDRAGQRLIISVCDRVVMEPLLSEPLTEAALVLTANDPQFLAGVEDSLRSATCDGVPIG